MGGRLRPTDADVARKRAPTARSYDTNRIEKSVACTLLVMAPVEMKSTPVIGGDTIYVNGYGAPVNDPGNKVSVPAADEVWKTADADGNGSVGIDELVRAVDAAIEGCP